MIFSIKRSLNIPRHLKRVNTPPLEILKLLMLAIGDRTFRAAGSRLWNSLPNDVVDCQTVDTFRRQLKQFFFIVCFP